MQVSSLIQNIRINGEMIVALRFLRIATPTILCGFAFTLLFRRAIGTATTTAGVAKPNKLGTADLTPRPRVPSPHTDRNGSHRNPGVLVAAAVAVGAFALTLQAGQNGRLANSGLAATGVAAATGIVTLLAHNHSKWLRIVYPRLGVASLSMAVLTGPLWYLYASRYADFRTSNATQVDFFSTAAQVLPILLLATLVEFRGDRGVPPGQKAAYVFVIAFGEITCLFHLAFTADTTIGFSLVSASLVGGLVGTLLSVLSQK